MYAAPHREAVRPLHRHRPGLLGSDAHRAPLEGIGPRHHCGRGEKADAAHLAGRSVAERDEDLNGCYSRWCQVIPNSVEEAQTPCRTRWTNRIDPAVPTVSSTS